MSARTCCGRGANIAGCVVPSVVLALLPKCPMCIVAYVAFFTGVGISFTAASYLRLALAFVSIACLLFIAGRFLLRLATEADRMH